MLSHGPDLNEEARLTGQIYEHLDTIERQADLIARLQAELAKRLPAGIQSVADGAA